MKKLNRIKKLNNLRKSAARQKRKEINPIEFNLLWSKFTNTSSNFIPSKIEKISILELNTVKSETAFHISIDPIKFNNNFNLNNIKND